MGGETQWVLCFHGDTNYATVHAVSRVMTTSSDGKWLLGPQMVAKTTDGCEAPCWLLGPQTVARPTDDFQAYGCFCVFAGVGIG